MDVIFQPLWFDFPPGHVELQLSISTHQATIKKIGIFFQARWQPYLFIWGGWMAGRHRKGIKSISVASRPAPFLWNLGTSFQVYHCQMLGDQCFPCRRTFWIWSGLWVFVVGFCFTAKWEGRYFVWSYLLRQPFWFGSSSCGSHYCVAVYTLSRISKRAHRLKNLTDNEKLQLLILTRPILAHWLSSVAKQ